MSSGTGVDLSSDKAGVQLLEVGLRSRATDVVITPGTLVGNLHLRSNFHTIHSTLAPMEAVCSLCEQYLEMAEMVPHTPLLETRLGTFLHRSARVRVSYTRTQNGPLLRLRIQSRGVLDEARRRFLRGTYGGTGVLPFLRLPTGLVLVVGLASAGKTSALSHLASQLDEAPRIVSEVSELGAEWPRLDPCGRSVDELVEVLGDGPGAPVVFDEMDEAEKLETASRLAAHRLVLATLAAPDLAAAVRKFLGRGLPQQAVLGFLKVDWEELETGRRPGYRWYPLGDGRPAHCPVCGQAREGAGPCAGCGIPPMRRFLDRTVLRKVNTPEGFRALDRLEHEWDL